MNKDLLERMKKSSVIRQVGFYLSIENEVLSNKEDQKKEVEKLNYKQFRYLISKDVNKALLLYPEYA